MSEPIELTVSCSDCVRRSTPDCEDCLVSFVLGGPPERLEMTATEADVVSLLTDQGLIPRLRFRAHSSLR